MPKVLYAYTDLDVSYPEYINFTQKDDGSVDVTVRGPRRPLPGRPEAHQPGETVVMNIPSVDFGLMKQALKLS